MFYRGWRSGFSQTSKMRVRHPHNWAKSLSVTALRYAPHLSVSIRHHNYHHRAPVCLHNYGERTMVDETPAQVTVKLMVHFDGYLHYRREHARWARERASSCIRN